MESVISKSQESIIKSLCGKDKSNVAVESLKNVINE